MSANNPEVGKKTQEKDLVITRIFDASRTRVWEAWTNPELLMRWTGPRSFTCPVYKTDLRVGGKYHLCMRSPEGHEFWSAGEYKEIVPGERLVCSDHFSDKQGNIVPASDFGLPGNWPDELLVTIVLEDHGNQTKMTLKQTGIPDNEMIEQTKTGWNESFDKMDLIFNNK